MFRETFFTLLLARIVIFTLAVQVPLDFSQGDHPDGYQPILGDEDFTEWNLSRVPNADATDHLVFETTNSLLQQWPNTRMRSGHNIVPGTIPSGTLLYHGRPDKELPSGPEWTATDPEHSFFFCRAIFTSSQSECWHLTLMATRPLKVVYFDGSSAAKLPDGSMDTQDLIAWGRIGRLFEDESNRITDLCKWGKNFGVDGFVRMEMDFEVMLCDFTSGINVVSFANLTSGWSNQLLIPEFNRFEVLHAGSSHYHFPGETRIQLDLPGLISFYDTQLVPSLVSTRAGLERWDHRASNVSKEDLSDLRSRLEANLIRLNDASSGIDWKTLIRVIVDRYAERLELTRHLLSSSVATPDGILDAAIKAQTQLRIMLTPYILFSAAPTNSSDKTELAWTVPIYKLCATTHTLHMESRFESMTDSEKLLLRAVRGTSREICRVLTKMWAAGVYAGVDPILDTEEPANFTQVIDLRDSWTEDLERLMAWLDWNVWIKCDPQCGPEEMCYLPTWPIGFPWLAPFPQPVPLPPDGGPLHAERQTSLFELRTMAMERFAHEASNAVRPEPDEWIRPQPKCIRRVKPYTY